MQIDCPNCDLKLTTADVNINTLVAKCTSCNSVFSVADQIDDYYDDYDDYDKGNSLKSDERPPLPLPSNIDREIKGEQLILRRRWLSSKMIPGLLIPIGLIGIIFFLMVVMGLSNLLFTPLFFCAAVPILVGIGLTYSTLASVLNTTTIVVDPSEISVKHSPIPWGKSVRIECSRIYQIYCTERWEANHVVNVMTEDEQIIKLSSLSSLEEGLYIEQEIEAHLGYLPKFLG